MSTGFASFITIIAGFLNIIIAVRFVPTEHFGVYILLQVVVFSLATISDLGINVSATKHLAGYTDENKYFVVNTLLSFRLTSALFLSFIIFLCKGLLHDLFKSDLFFDIAIYIPVLFVMESLSGLLASMLQGFHYYRKMAIAQIILSVLGIIFIIVFLVYLHLGLIGLIYARIISLFFCITYQLNPFVRRLTMRFDKRLFMEVFRFGFPLGLNNILTFIFMRIDTLMIGSMLSPIQVAYYGTSSKIPDASRNMFESFRSVFFPNMSELFSQGNKAEAKKLLDNSLRIVSFLSLFCTLVVILFQRQIVEVLFSARYLESAPILALLMIALSIGLISNILGTSLVSAGYSKLPVLINIVDTLVTIAANLILIPIFGVIGAAYAAILARALTNPVNVWFLKKKGVEMCVGNYMKPVIIFAVFMAIYTVTGITGIFFNLIIITLFLAACIGLEVITRADLLGFMQCIKYRGTSSNSDL